MKWCLPVIGMLMVLQSSAQYSKVVVQLTDKGNGGFSLSTPGTYLSGRAIARRNRFHIAIDSSDLPVSAAYIDSIRGAGAVNVLSSSKWLNQVLIETTDQIALQKIKLFPFVKQSFGVAYRKARSVNGSKSAGMPKPLRQTASRKTGADDVLNYGNNFDQVHIHNGEFLHNKRLLGQTMQIALLDAGFYQYNTVTAFDSLRNDGRMLGVRDFVAFDNSVVEDDSHGTYCLSVLTADWPGKMVGTAPKASYWLIRTEDAGSEFPVEEHNWVVGAEFADSAGCDLISSSLGYNQFNDASLNHSYNDFYKNTTMVSRGAAMAVNKGIIVSNSAGNEGNSNWKYLLFPADVDSVCSVGSVSTSGAISGFSSYGYAGKVKPNIVSVGDNAVVAGLNNQPGTLNGTSFANPNVAGLMACLWQAFPAVSNTKVLAAVYQSCNRFSSPDNRYGYGIPDFRVAYRLLKHEQNITLFGNTWFFANPGIFADTLAVKVIGRIDGSATLQLLSSSGAVVASHAFTSEQEEVFNYTFTHLADLPAGFYSVRYTDSTTTSSLPVEKGNILAKDWLVPVPNPFGTGLNVFLQAPETGPAQLRLVAADGSIVGQMNVQLTQNEKRVLTFNNVQALAKGGYFLQYISPLQKRVLSLLKQ